MSPAELILFERDHWHHPQREELIRRRGLHPVRYTQLLLRAARTPDGMQACPMTCRRVLARTERPHR